MTIKSLRFRKEYLKIISSEAIRGIKLKLCRNVYGVGLYKNGVFLAIANALSLLGQLKVSIDYNGKSENWPLLLCHCIYFDKIDDTAMIRNRYNRIPLPSKDIISERNKKSSRHKVKRSTFSQQMTTRLS